MLSSPSKNVGLSLSMPDPFDPTALLSLPLLRTSSDLSPFMNSTPRLNSGRC